MSKQGIYQHYSGKKVEVLMVALHIMLDEEFIVYREIESGVIRTQPASRFFAPVTVGIHPMTKVPRFKYLGD